MRARFVLFLATILSCIPCLAQANRPVAGSKPQTSTVKICARCIHAYEEYLASDALNGRGSATHDELVAATYLASKFEEFGIAPAGDNGSYLQKVSLIRRKFAIPPQLRFT